MIKNKDININKNINTNYIIAEYDIKEEDVNKNIRIITSYEEWMRTNGYKEIENEYKNEKQIKDCEIEINGELIPFNYFYQIKSKRKLTTKYSFNNNIDNTAYMFNECSSLTYIDLSNFNSNNATNICYMFNECSSLTHINLSNFNTKNVIDMGYMFNGCSSLTSIDLSSFNTNNVTNMSCMFRGCSSLTRINLSNFNTDNATNMRGKFRGCSNLRNKNVIVKDKKILNEFE